MLIFYLARNDISHGAVQYIIDSVIEALDENPDRRFIYVEIAYFWRWWYEQTEEIRNKVRGFVNEGQRMLSDESKYMRLVKVGLNSFPAVGV